MSDYIPYPMHTHTHAIGARAIAILHYQLDCCRWVFRQKTGDDYGVDCELELVENSLLRGRKIECQVKGTADIKKHVLKTDRSIVSFGIPVKTINHALGCHNPFVVFAVDIVSEQVYFESIKPLFRGERYLEAKSQNSEKSIRFNRNRLLLSSQSLLQEIAFENELEFPSA